MPTVNLSLPPILQFFNNSGAPNVGGSLLTQVGGINYPTYQDAAGLVPLPNPIPLNSRGEVSNSSGVSSQLYLDSDVNYTLTLYDAFGNQIWQGSINQLALSTSIGATLVGYIANQTGAVATTVASRLDWEPISIFNFMSEVQRNDVQSGGATSDVASAIQKAHDAAGSVPLGSPQRYVTGWGKCKVLTGINGRAAMMGQGGGVENGLGLTFSWQGSGDKVFEFATYDSGWFFEKFRIDSTSVTTDVTHMYFDAGLNGADFELVELRGFHSGAAFGGTYKNHDGIYINGGIAPSTKFDISQNTFKKVSFNRLRNGFTATDPSGQGAGNGMHFDTCFSWCNGWTIKACGANNQLTNNEFNAEAGNHTVIPSGPFAVGWVCNTADLGTADPADGNQPFYFDTPGSANIVSFKGGTLEDSNAGGLPALVKDAGATGGKSIRYSVEGMNNENSTTYHSDSGLFDSGILSSRNLTQAGSTRIVEALTGTSLTGASQGAFRSLTVTLNNDIAGCTSATVAGGVYFVKNLTEGSFAIFSAFGTSTTIIASSGANWSTTYLAATKEGIAYNGATGPLLFSLRGGAIDYFVWCLGGTG